MRVGIKDVAKAAGVSIATVSLVLNDKADHRIPERTRERVRQAAREVGYTPNSLARSLRTRRTHTIGLVSDRIATTPYAVRMIAAAEQVAAENAHLIFLVDTDGDLAVSTAAVQTLQDRQVDGLVYACMWHQVLGADQLPPGLPAGTVFLDARPADGGYPAVVPDDHAGGVAAVEELLGAGHRRIGLVDIDEEPEPVASTLRREAWRRTLTEAGVAVDPDWHVRVASTAAGGREGLDRLLALPAERRPTAVFCFNDRMAMGVYTSARHHGLRIPEDLSVVGYDDQELIAAEMDPGLTTVALPHAAMGRWAMEVRLGVREPPEDEVLRLPCPLIRRGSVAPPPGGPDGGT